MFLIYQIVILLIILLSPIIIIIRLLKNKEHTKRFIEKFCFFQKKRNKGNLIWIHAASVGELMSIIPLIYEIEKNKKIDTILITTSTLSSSKIFKNYKFKKVIHQFFPIDFFYFSSKFIEYWKPCVAIFIDSEIWPSIFKKLKKKSVPLLLMNARITPKSFARWNFFNKFSKNIFHNISKAYPQNQESRTFLKKLNVKKIDKIGNLKFCEEKKASKLDLNKSFLLSTKNRLIFCASSTHPGEESTIAKSHLKLKKKYKNLFTIIIPRHVERIDDIYKNLKSLNLNTIIRSSGEKVNHNTDIYLVDTYGETKKFFNISKIAFIGGSIINHGGQNPIEPARFGLDILHGPNIQNFKDIYQFFNKNKVAHKFVNLKQLVKISDKLLLSKKKKKLNLTKIGNLILKNHLIEINKILNNELEKAKILGP